MTPERWQTVERVYHEALAREPSQRAEYLREACANDDVLRLEVEALLEQERRADGFLEAPAWQSVAAALEPSNIGRVIGSFEIVSPLGAGGMGEVYRARDRRLDRDVALKFLSPELTRDAAARERLGREALAASALNHPHICTLHDVVDDDGQPVLVMEIVEGQPLSAIVAKEGLPIETVVRIGEQLADALAHAHAHGIIHRDLKPSNIVVTTDGRAKVLDFGIARHVHGGDLAAATQAETALTEAGVIAGTLPYMAPEVLNGRPADARSDIWALGVVLYEMATGTRPFSGTTGFALTGAILHDPLPPLPARVPGTLRRILQKCLAKEPSQRYQSAREIGVALETMRADPTGATSPSASRAWLWPGIVAVITVMIVGSYVLASRFSPRQASSFATEKTRIVVLPFENLGPPADEYFAGGLTEEITSRLAVVNGLGVISRNSAVQYAKSSKNTKTIGLELNVDYILGGSVRWEPAANGTGRVRITPQLIRVSDDTHVWTERYERTVSEIFQVQAEIAERVAEELDLALLAPERRAIEARPTENIEAYQAYLRGVHYDASVDRITESVTRRVAEMFEQAVALDPRFALAYARLSQAYSDRYRLGQDRSEERLAKARHAAEQALALQPTLPRGHFALGVYYYSRFDYDAALREYAVAQRAMQDDSDLHARIASAHRRQGRFEEALADWERAMKLNPQSAELARERASTNVNLRRYAEAIRLYDVSLGVDPQQALAFNEKALTLVLATGAIREARATLEQMPDTKDQLFVWTWLRQEILERQYRKALVRVSTMPFTVISLQDRFLPKALLQADLHQLLGESDTARSNYEEAALILEREKTSRPDDARVHSALGMAYAGLGRKAEAVLEAKLGEELRPFSKDALVGPIMTEHVARVYTSVGEPDAALDQIERLLSGPIRFTIHMLELDPAWDALRQRPRYRALLDKFGRDPMTGAS